MMPGMIKVQEMVVLVVVAVAVVVVVVIVTVMMMASETLNLEITSQLVKHWKLILNQSQTTR